MKRFLLTVFSITTAFLISAKPQGLASGIDRILGSYLDSGFSGVVIVVKNDTVVLHKAYGYANNETKVLNTTKTLFNVASIGKQFTAATVLILEEKGLLNTRDYISKYVGLLGGQKDSATIEHLLLHNSGLFLQGTALNYNSRDSFIASVKNSPLESRPGEKYRYSNAGYTLLAAIIEIVTKEPFENVLYKTIFQPASMMHTGYPWEDRIPKSLMATGYLGTGEPQPPAANIWGNMGPGNLVTGTDDMLKWYRVAWRGDKLISPTIKARMLTDPIPGKETYSWNKGTTTKGKRFYHKGGGRPDFENNVMWWPDDNIYLFFSINNDRNLRRLIFRDISAFVDKL